MKTWEIKAAGGPEQLVLVDRSLPRPEPGQAVVSIEAAGIGFADVMMRSGMYPGVDPTGWHPGEEIAGMVTAVGEGVSAQLIGRRVYAFCGRGGYAEAICLDAAMLVELPEAVSCAAAVASGVNALVGRFALERARVTSESAVLVRGASGGMGSTIVQLAVAAGAICTAATSKPDEVAALGAHDVVDRTGGEGLFDAIIDPVAGDAIGQFIDKLKPNGSLMICGAAAGFPPPEFGSGLLLNFLKSPTLSVVSLNSMAPGALVSAAGEVLRMVEQGLLTPLIARTVSLDGVPDAHRDLAENNVLGKIVIELPRQ